MSAFYFGDTVVFTDDPEIIGTIDSTWSDIDTEPSETSDGFFIHKSLPSEVCKTWLKEERLLPGYVIVEFMLPQDGFCLVAESFLKLRDRALVMTDIVKRKASDVQSGVVISTSIECTLDPVCSLDEYASPRPILAQGHMPSQGPQSRRVDPTRMTVHGFPAHEQTKLLPLRDLAHKERKGSLRVPAHELTYWNDFREEDYVIYQDWVGVVGAILDEVTVRLANGSVVVVESPQELEVPYYVPGTSSYELVQRLDRAGYYRHSLQKNPPHLGKPSTIIDHFYPGQHVQTKKGNLRRGRWKFGAYDPNTEPQGVVVDVRTIELEVNWLSPNILKIDLAQGAAPPYVLDADVLQSGAVHIYNRNRLPKQTMAVTLPGATYSPDTAFGNRLRFKDPAGAAVKYASTFKRIPRAQTQGYEMNVLHIISTMTKVLVRWQDCSISEEFSNSLIPTHNVDEYDVWPGDRVSLKSDEQTSSGQETSQGQTPGVRLARTIGVVQNVNAAERLAKVQWFDNAEYHLDAAQQTWASSASTYGYMSLRTTEVSLYDIAAYPAFDPRLGDLVLAFPFDAVPALDAKLADYFGEVVELCSDGQIIVRCGGVSEARDVKVVKTGLTVIASDEILEGVAGDQVITGEDEDDEGWSEDYTNTSDEEDASDVPSLEPIDVQIEYEGGANMDLNDDEEAWTTDADDDIDPALRFPRGEPNATELNGHDLDVDSESAPEMSIKNLSAPAPFLILEETPPSDHHFIGEGQSRAGDLVKRAMKEHKIMRSSLPEGVFVRSWESRLDLLRVLIVGPVGTPYEHAPFMFDLHFGPSFPEIPPDTFFHSWTNNLGRINPNLYEDGKICLSLLGTWPSDERNESWSPKKSTVLQVLVSILGLVLVKEPYYNEAGFEVLVGSADSRVAAQMYSEKAYVMAKGFLKTALYSPPKGLADVLQWLYLSESGPRLLVRIIDDCQLLSVGPSVRSGGGGEDGDENDQMEATWAISTQRLTAGALVLLKRHLKWLVECKGKNEAKEEKVS